jgi:uncharacterized protein (TIGR02217 family)
MAFLETPIFPGRVGMRATRTLNQSIETVRTFNRRAIKNINSSQGWRGYSFVMPMTGTTEFELLQAHYLAAKGTAHQFRFEDWADYKVLQADGFLGQSGVGTGVPSYQLHKRYVTGTLTEWRAIRKPKTSGNTVFRNGGAATVGGAAGNYALDSTTGIVTWVADSSSAVSSHTVGTTHQVTLGGALSGLIIGGRLYLTGVTGTAATLLNGIAHNIANIAGATYTLSVNTVGLTATSGTGFKYPQPADTLAWSGQFDTPVSYETEIAFTNEAQSVYIGQQVLLIEEAV